MMEKNWIIKEQGHPAQVKHMIEVLGVEYPIANLLVQRGITSFDQAKAFFRPSLSNLYDPFLMKDMEVAVNRLQKAIKDKEKIMIYGDYDVDGTTAVSMFITFLKNFTQNLIYYIPNRYTEGYGISFKGIDYAAHEGVTLIISLDCGIKATEKVAYARQKGIDFIICDHHTAGKTLPDAVAVLDPKRADCNYPYKELSGCGVGFKLLQAFCMRNNIDLNHLYDFLDLVAVSIASDIVPITGENRILAYFGLQKLNTNPRSGLKAIIKIAGIEGKNICIDDIVFKIGPRINAAGRIETGKSSVELLIAEDEQEAFGKGDLINDFNNTRKNIDANITKEALDLIASNKEMQSRYTTVVYKPDWHKGVIGIVASRLIETYYRPTIVFTDSNGLITGSARSVAGFDLYKAIESCSHLLESFGGHMYAAGLTLRKENFVAFQKLFEKVVAENIHTEQVIPSVEIDMELRLKDITPKLLRIIKQFEPFGPENMAPVFFTENVVDDGSGRPVGNQKEHLKLNLLHEDEPFKPYPAIGFNLANIYPEIAHGTPFDICYCIEENEYRGQKNIQLRIKDIKPDKRTIEIKNNMSKQRESN
ncbi:MAG: single-stranded-DNA-specific exonuclease RecJ [Bacteroidales bacterium]|nr:single-stranded-DNA-specific exonuclease RecJ [Bacteroidales bacterium]